MKTLSDYTNEDAIDVLADIIEPASIIFQDKNLQMLSKQGNLLKLARAAMKWHKREVLEILARIDGEDIETYRVTAPQIIVKLMSILQNKDLMYFFGFADQREKEDSSGSATENTQEEEA